MLSGGVAGLYGGEANEVIRFMAGPSEPDADEHRDEERYLAELASEVSVLDAIPLVTSVNLYSDGSAIALNKTGVSVSLQPCFLNNH